MTRIVHRMFGVVALLLAGIAIRGPLDDAVAAASPVEVRLGTILPRDSSYERILREMGQKWGDATGHALKLTVYPGAGQGGEAEIVRRMRGGQLSAAMLSAVGLSNIDRSVTCLQYMPMVFRSWEEVDYVRDRLGPQLEKRLFDKGFVVLAWGDAGWVRFFSKTPVVRPDDLKRMNLFAWEGDPYQVDLMKALGYQPRPLETGDILQGLTTGMIAAAPVTPSFALASQCDRSARNMLALDWAPIVGAVIIRKDVWDSFPPAALEKIRQAASEAGVKLRIASRMENEEAVAEMQKRGLKVQALSPEAEAEWRRLAEGIYPKIRGKMVPEDMFDRVRNLLDERRGEGKAGAR